MKPYEKEVSPGLHGEAGMSRNLEAVGDVVSNYCRWNLSVFQIPPKARILDIGCGPGLYMDAIAEYEPQAYLGTDHSPAFVEEARKRIGSRAQFRAEVLDILAPEGSNPLFANEAFDCALCFDVIEHLPDDIAALRGIRAVMLGVGARRLFLRVPALSWLYGENDRAIGHYRRYTRASLRTAMMAAGFGVERIAYQNILGILPWLIIGRVQRRQLAVSRDEGRLFDALVPALRWVEGILPPPIGLSVYCEATPEPRA